MSVLLAIWLAALALTTLSVSWFLFLIAQRFVTTRGAAALAKDRRAVEAALVGVMQGRVDVGLALAVYRTRARLMAEAVLEFTAVVRGGDRDIVLGALEAVGVPSTLRSRLNRGSAAGRLAVTEALAAFPGPETERALRDLAARDPALRFVALESLAKAGGEVPVRTLIDAVMQGDLKPTGRFASFLCEQIVADPAGGVAALARTDLTPPVRCLVLDALGASGDYSVIPILQAHAASGNALVRAAAVAALGRLQHPGAEPTIAAALDDEDGQVRAAAAQAAAAGRLTGLTDRLVQRVEDPAWQVRFESARALAAFGPAGHERLRALAAQDGSPAARAAELTLAEQGLT